ncbi:MAG TPA: hypothetical protein VI194_11795 [Mycobacterium sp.]
MSFDELPDCAPGELGAEIQQEFGRWPPSLALDLDYLGKVREREHGAAWIEE